MARLSLEDALQDIERIARPVWIVGGRPVVTSYDPKEWRYSREEQCEREWAEAEQETA